MDPYHQTSHVPPLQNTSGISTGHQATSNYVLQVDPNSGHYEIIDSSLVTVPSSTRTVELTTGCGGGGDEAVYKIRDDEDFYIRPITGGDQRFSTIDIDPVMDVGDIFSRNVIQTQQQPDQMQQQQQQIQLPVQNIQFVQQLENHQLAVTPHQHHHLQAHPIQAQLQIQPSQHQPQINYALEEVGGGLSMPLGLESYQVQQQPATTIDVGGSGQVSGTIMSIVSSFISPGATAVQVDNNLIIYDPSGQIIQIPLPNQTSNPTSIQTVVPTSSISSSSSGYQFQTVQTSSQSVSDNNMGGWVDFSSSAGNILLDTSTSSVASSVPQQQYLSVGNNNMTTIQFPPDQREYSISTTSTEPSSEASYYTMQNVELLPTTSTQSSMPANSGTTFPLVTRTNEGVSNSSDLHHQNLCRQGGCIDGHETVSSVIGVSNKFVEASVHANIEKPIKESPIQEKVESRTNSENAPVTTTTATAIVDLPMKTAPSDPVKNQTDDNFDIKIVSCYSLSQSASQNLTKTESLDETSTAGCEERKDCSDDSPVESPRVENDQTDVKSSEIAPEADNDPQSNSTPVRDACHFVKELRKLKHILPATNSRPANTPKWLLGYVDADDELLIAFKNRADPMQTDICHFCYRWFYSFGELQKHVKKEHANKDCLHSCNICGARFIARVLKLRHEKLHKYDLKHRSIVYLRHPELKKHFRKRFRPAPFSPWYESHIRKVCNLVSDIPFTCFDCGTEFSSSDYVQDHYERVHAMQVCGFCGVCLSNTKSLIQHEQEIHGHYSITENYVGGAWGLWEHWQCEESIKQQVIQSNVTYFHSYALPCADSVKVYEEDFIDRHVEFNDDDVTVVLESHPHDPKEDAASELSNPESSLSVSLDDENLGDSGVRLPFACDHCTKSYDNEFDLKRHGRCHGSPSKANLACQYCGRVFKTHSHKKEHERTHTGEKPYVCPICQRSFIQSSNLKKHMQTHQQSSLQCGTCGKQFIKEASLILHQRAHAQDRKFRCAICDRAYNYASLLKRHMRIHTGEMPYSCESCGMLFHELVSLHYHRKKVHTGERPHKCDTCGRAFILSSDLKKHVQIHLKPPSDRPVLKPLRKRSQSKSLDKSDNLLDTPLSSPNPKHHDSGNRISIYSAQANSINLVNSIIPEDEELDNDWEEEEEEEEEEETQSILSPSPCSSLENEIISNKPAVVRVYSRKDQRNSNHNSPTLKERETTEQHQEEKLLNNDSSQSTSVFTNSHISKESEPMEIDNNEPTPTPTSFLHQQHSSAPTQPSPVIISQPPTTNKHSASFLPHHSLISEEDAALLLAINRGDFNHSTNNAVFSTSSHDSVGTFTPTREVPSVETLPKSIDDVLQLSEINQFNDLITNIMVVPDASSEIEIILDDKNNRQLQ